MKLEDEIHMAVPFESEHQKAMLNLAYTYNVFLGRTLKVLRPFDINDQHYNILKILEHHHPKSLSVGDIKKLLLTKRGDLTRLLDKLCYMGLVHREVNAENRRGVCITLTQKGKEKLMEIDAKLTEQRDPSSNISEKEVKQLNKLLDKLRG